LIIICYMVIIILVIVLVITIFNALTAPVIKKINPGENKSYVSVLIPARNESRNIQACLEDLIKQDYANYEIIVLDDDSSDNTAQIVEIMTKKNRRIRLIRGKRLPAGWTGKNWACYQLSRQAKGNFLIFSDADNRYKKEAITKTVSWMQKLNLDFFSAFPQQFTKTIIEKLVVPTVYMSVYCYLPLWLTYKTKFPSIAAANGQWIAFKKSAYQQLGGHAVVQGKIAEDTELARLAKKKKMKILTAVGTGLIFARMYHNREEVWHGFSKNLFGLMGGHPIPFLFILFLMFLIYILPYFCIFFLQFLPYAIIAIVINVIMRLILSVKYKDPFMNVILHPLAVITTIIIGFHSFFIYQRGRVQWKNREIILNR
jgi:chlorobactene glucosyltransferase